MKRQDSRRGSELFHHEGHEGVKGTAHRSAPTIPGPVPGAPQSHTQSPDSAAHRIPFFVLFMVDSLRPPVLLRNRHPSCTTEIRRHYTIETTRNLFFLSLATLAQAAKIAKGYSSTSLLFLVCPALCFSGPVFRCSLCLPVTVRQTGPLAVKVSVS